MGVPYSDTTTIDEVVCHILQHFSVPLDLADVCIISSNKPQELGAPLSRETLVAEYARDYEFNFRILAMPPNSLLPNLDVSFLEMLYN